MENEGNRLIAGTPANRKAHAELDELLAALRKDQAGDGPPKPKQLADEAHRIVRHATGIGLASDGSCIIAARTVGRNEVVLRMTSRRKADVAAAALLAEGWAYASVVGGFTMPTVLARQSVRCLQCDSVGTVWSDADAAYVCERHRPRPPAHQVGVTPDGDPVTEPCDCNPGECPFPDSGGAGRRTSGGRS